MMDKNLIARIRSGLATAADLTAENAEEVLAVRRDTSVPQSRFFAEKAFGVVKDKRQVLGVPHSTEGVDRMGDIIRLKGWQLDAYKKNPVLLFGHDKGSLPIAKAMRVRRGQSASGMKALLIDEQFHEADLNPEAELVWRMVESGALPGRSVGFLPIEIHAPETEEEREKLGLGKWGLEFIKQELLESSIVPVPANAEALQGKCYAIAQATAKQAVEDGVATWTDVQRLAGILPITELDASRIEREQRRSHVAFPEGTTVEDANRELISAFGRGLDNEIMVHLDPNTGFEYTGGRIKGTLPVLSDGPEIIVPMPVDNTIPITLDVTRNAPKESYDASTACSFSDEYVSKLYTKINKLEDENEQLRTQVQDLTRALGALSRATEDRSDDAEQTLERSSNDDTEERFFDTLFEKVEERRKAKQFNEELASRLATRLGTGEGQKE